MDEGDISAAVSRCNSDVSTRPPQSQEYSTTRPYRPSNGAEGADFISAWCGHCRRDADYQDGAGDGCPIVAATFALDVDDVEYPAEWICDDVPTFDTNPRCTAFEPICDGGVIRDRRQTVLGI